MHLLLIRCAELQISKEHKERMELLAARRHYCFNYQLCLIVASGRTHSFFEAIPPPMPSKLALTLLVNIKNTDRNKCETSQDLRGSPLHTCHVRK